jgi:hypothetical protein
MIHSDYEHLVLHRHRQRELERAGAVAAHARAMPRAPHKRLARAAAHSLGAMLIAAGHSLKSL